jgi:hypothetical protein
MNVELLERVQSLMSNEPDAPSTCTDLFARLPGQSEVSITECVEHLAKSGMCSYVPLFYNDGSKNVFLMLKG